MKVLKITIAFFFLLGHCCLFSQSSEVMFGKVPSEDLKMEIYTKEPMAEAVILAKTSELVIKDSDQLIFNFQNFTRIKILNKNAFNLGNINIDYFSFYDSEYVSGLKAMISYPDGRTYKLKRSNFKRYRLDGENTRISFSFPKLEEGAIIEFQYRLRTNDMAAYSRFDFQYDIPVKYANFSFSIPQNVDYQFDSAGDSFIKANENNFTMIDIPSMEEGPFTTIINNYKGHITLQIIGMLDSYLGYIPIVSTWEKIGNELNGAEDFGLQMKEKRFHDDFISKAQPILNESCTMETKILKLQNFILEHVKWNNSFDIFSLDLNESFKKGEANSGELNMMMIVLLRELGFKANPMLVGLREQGKILPNYPLLSQFEHLICVAEISEKPLFIDVSDKYRSPGDVRFNSLNGIGMILNDNKINWQMVIPNRSSDVFLGEFDIENGSLVGKVKGKYDGYSAFYERSYFGVGDVESPWKKRLRKKFPRTNIIESYFENLDSLNTSFVDGARVEIPGACIKIKDTLFVDPFFHFSFSENPFEQENRAYPINFGHPFVENLIFQVEIPEGYTLSRLPESTSISNEDRTLSYQLSATQLGDKIQLTTRLNVDKIEFMPDENIVLKKIFDIIFKKSEEKIVLVKT